MSTFSELVDALRNVPVHQFIAALDKDGFAQVPRRRGSHRVYEHPDGRVASLSFHKGSATLPIKPRRTLLQQTEWNESDAVRLGLLKRRR